MDQLSLGARTMLRRRKRRHTVTKREDLIERIIRAGLPVFEPIVVFQMRYGGMEYRVRGSGHGFSFDLFIGRPNEPQRLYGEEDPLGCWAFECGHERVAQFGFFVRQDGAICVDGDDDVLLPVASSVEKYIESDAMHDGLMAIQAKWWMIYLSMPAVDHAVDAVLAQGRTVVDVASDAYTTWWANEYSRICRRTMFMSEPTNQVVAYLSTRDAAAQLAEAVHPFIGDTPDVFSHPFDVEEHRAATRRRRGLTGPPTEGYGTVMSG
jgi:hypothetical protein